MTPDRAWVKLNSGRRLDLLDPQPGSWEDSDLATGLARTYRWGGHSRWELPLSVAQHSLLVLALRRRMAPAALSRAEARRELLHDASEGLLSFDPISPVKPHLGPDFEALDLRLRRAIDARYALAPWQPEEYAAHKRADRLAAASEAVHVAGWSRADLAETLRMELEPEWEDPLPPVPGAAPWEPWPAKVAAARFLEALESLAAA